MHCATLCGIKRWKWRYRLEWTGLFCFGNNMRVKLLFLLMLIAPRVVVASVASTGYVTEYVKQQSETKS